jgi:hypothetical protein
MKLITIESCSLGHSNGDIFGKYKYISNKGELKGNHRGSGSPFQIQGLGDTEVTGGMNTVSVTSRKFSRSIYGS